MKATKKIVCLTLAIVLAGLAFIMPVSAAGATPLVIVDGFNSTKLYTDFGTENQKEAFFGSDTDIEAMITDVGGAFIGGLLKYGYNDKDFEAFADSFIPALNKYFEPIAYNTDGTPKNEIGYYETKKPISEYTDEEKAQLFTTFTLDTAKEYGEDKAYCFSYDWRKSPEKIASELDAFIDMVQEKGKLGERYNIGGHNEKQNIEIINIILETLQEMLPEGDPRKELVSTNLITYVEDRKGHDRRYAIAPDKIKEEIGWYPETMFKDGIKLTIKWFFENEDWMKNVTSGDYQKYYEEMYK